MVPMPTDFDPCLLAGAPWDRATTTSAAAATGAWVAATTPAGRWSVRLRPTQRSGTMSAWRCRSGPTLTSSTRSISTSPRRRLRSSRRWRPSQAAIPWYGSLHRGGGRKSAYSTTLFEESRRSVARFVGCDNADDVVFVRNTTEAANLLAVALPPGTRVLCSSFEHHANLLPWRQHRVTHLPFTTTAAALLAAAADALEEAERAGDPFSLVAITRRLERHRRGAAGRRGRPPRPRAGRARLRRRRAARTAPPDRPPRARSRLPRLLRAQGLRAVRHRCARLAGGRARRRIAAPARRRRRPDRHARGRRLGRDAETVRGRHAQPARCRRARRGLQRPHVLRDGGRRRGGAARSRRALGRSRRDRRRAQLHHVAGCARPRRRRRVHGRGLGGARARRSSGRPRDRRARRIVLRPSASSPTCSASRALETAHLLHETECGEDVIDSRRRSRQRRARHDAGRHRRLPRRARRGRGSRARRLRRPCDRCRFPPHRSSSWCNRSDNDGRRRRGVHGTGVRRPRRVGAALGGASARPRTRGTWPSRRTRRPRERSSTRASSSRRRRQRASASATATRSSPTGRTPR